MSSLDFNYDEIKYTKFRRDLHKYPELSNKEFETQKKTLDLISKFKNYDDSMLTSFESEPVPETGFWIDVQGEGQAISDSKFISLRCDMDALPLDEETNVEYISVNDGIAHSCGHDGHVTILCCTLEHTLLKIKDIPSNIKIRFLYQPAEEGMGGALKMIGKGCLKNIDEIYGIHNMPIYPLGYVAIKEGPLMAASNSFKITINGKGGHGSTPHLCNSPITTGSEIIQKINEITSQRIDSAKRSVVTVGKFVSGEAPNVIPDQAEIMGSIRTFDEDVAPLIKKEIETICKDISQLNKSEVNVEISDIGLVTSNEKDTYLSVVESLKESKLILTSEGLPIAGSEDFSNYQKAIKGSFILLGSQDSDHTEIPHNPKFDYNDKATVLGAEIYLRLIQYKSLKKLFNNK